MCIKAAISRQRISVQIQSLKSAQSLSKMIKLLAMIFMTIVISHVAELKAPSKKKIWKILQKLEDNVDKIEEAIVNGFYKQTVILKKAIS